MLWASVFLTGINTGPSLSWSFRTNHLYNYKPKPSSPCSCPMALNSWSSCLSVWLPFRIQACTAVPSLPPESWSTRRRDFLWLIVSAYSHLALALWAVEGTIVMRICSGTEPVYSDWEEKLRGIRDPHIPLKAISLMTWHPPPGFHLLKIAPSHKRATDWRPSL